ncbi:replication initiator protein A (plasmid) [Acidovorax sp. GBBC 1281]|uniref:replication initiator protein A n=1 Tax=Acidovorax sp. GBBC 1281 TaxID=2940492 RepID=UPI00234B3AB9|nr:replication initiator protein A [Acidovorax sp. GBBC 1281]WCN00562.1 replication initiator protein A [Acidovorax sp. GBBC 1281]BDH38306.1 replication initiator protein A [Acidovorax sp. SUPP2522]
MSSANGPKQIGDALGDSLDRLKIGIAKRHREKVEAAARPGETFAQAESRLRAEDAAKEREAAQEKERAQSAAIAAGRQREDAAKAASSMRKPPEGDAQSDFFVPLLYDVATKDSRSIMDVAVFRLSKKDKRANETIRYTRPDGYVEVVSGEAGMASVWDYDIVLMAISHLTDAMNLYRQGRGEKPSRIFRPHVSEILKFCRRSDGGRQYEEIEGALKRLSTTFVEVVTTTQAKGKRALRTAKGVGLINGYETVSYADNGRLTSVSIEVPQWLYNEVVEVKSPAVLTVHPEYFLIEPGIGRFLYRLARRAAGKARARWTFKLIYERSGSVGTFKEFCRILRKLIASNDLPEYTLAEVLGKSGPLLVMTHRDALPDELPELPEDDDGAEGDDVGDDVALPRA